MTSPALLLLLHAHLPWVREPGHAEFLEEDWFCEAMAECYLPLLRVLHRLADDAVPFRLTLTISPVLAAQWNDAHLLERFERWLERGITLAETVPTPVAAEHAARLREVRADFSQRWNRNIAHAFSELQKRGRLELGTCAATHGFLPLLAAEPAAVRGQLALTARTRGIWLPECAWSPELEPWLRAAGFRWFIVEEHALAGARAGHFAPCWTRGGLAAFARDSAATREVWSAETGFPGGGAYREFHRDHGWELIGKPAGLKLHRVTSRTTPLDEKQPYDRTAALAQARSDARTFVAARQAQLATLAGLENATVVCPFDAELFGHWWFEGPDFLDELFREAARVGMRLATPGDVLDATPKLQVFPPAASSWGAGGHAAVWLNEATAWIYPELHRAARESAEICASFLGKQNPPDVEHALDLLVCELLLAQASDWPFLITTGTARSYAESRLTRHLERHRALAVMLRAHAVDAARIASWQTQDGVCPRGIWQQWTDVKK